MDPVSCEVRQGSVREAAAASRRSGRHADFDDSGPSGPLPAAQRVDQYRSARWNLGAALAGALCAAALSLAPAPAHAQTITKNLVRAFNQCDQPAPYVYDYSFFTATGPEALITYSRTHVACSEVCQVWPPPPFPGGTNSCNHFCGPTDPCPYSHWKCDCHGNPCNGFCKAGVDLSVGYVVVLKVSRFCAIAACAGLSFPDCPASSCDGSGTCSDSNSNAQKLCMCPDPACPIGQRICDSSRPTLSPSDVALEAFSSASNPDWVLGLATISSDVLQLNGTATPTSIAENRFATVPGQAYVAVTKWSTFPIMSGFQTCPDAALELSLQTRADSCGP